MNEYREIIETENGFIDGVGAVISGRPIGGTGFINKGYDV